MNGDQPETETERQAIRGRVGNDMTIIILGVWSTSTKKSGIDELYLNYLVVLS